MSPGKPRAPCLQRHKLTYHSDFGLGHLPTSASQGIDSTYILVFWGKLTNDKRVILEQTLRGLPLTRFSCLEKVLRHLETHFSRNSFTNRTGRLLVLRDISSCSAERLKAYLMILTTPGRDYASSVPETKDLMRAIRDKDLDDSDWKPDYLHVEEVEAKEARKKLARAREHVKWISLQHAVQSLPLELNLLIRDTMHEEIFGPGKEIIFPYEEPTYVQHFQALDRQLYEKYSNVYYCQNMWVTREGSGSWLFQYNSAIREVLSKIRNVTLKWTWKDARESCRTRPDVQEYIDYEMKIGGTAWFDNLEVMVKFGMTCREVVKDLLRTWSEKSYEIGLVQLDKLVIDAREAFAPDGEFLGLAAAHRWAESTHRPHCLEIWVPNDDEDLAGQIFHIIAGKYS